MGSPGRIVVGVDFSETSARALREARQLAARLGAPLEVLHVRESRSGQPWAPDDAELSWLDREGVGEGELVTRGGTPWLELVRFTWTPGADLVVVGTHGRSGAHPLALGSNANRLVLTSPRPVVLVGHRGSTIPNTETRR